MSALTITCKLLRDASVGAAIYPIVIPQTAVLPSVVVTLIHEEQEFVTAGATQAFTARLSTACLASDAAGMDLLAETVKSTLKSIVQHDLADDTRVTFWKEGTDVSDWTDDRSTYRRILDWRMRWERP